jgi:chromosome segregation ATPase
MLLAFAALALGQPQRTPVQHKDVPESAEHRYARQKLAEATKRCAALQAQYEDLESKIEDAVLKGTGLSRDVHPVVTTCKALEERSGRLIKAVERNNELIGEAHKQWLQHAQRMIELGAKPRPEKKTGELIPIDMLRQLSETAETHDRIVEELPTLESRLVHADDCVAIYRKTIDEKVSDLLSLP